MVTSSRLTAAATLVALVLANAGCGSLYDGPELFPVVGSVSYNGTPIPEATVIFTPQSQSGSLKSLQALTDEQGRFELYTATNSGHDYLPGAPAGEYSAAVTKYADSPTGPHSPPKPLLPMKYSNARSSGLTASVVAGETNDFTFSLSNK